MTSGYLTCHRELRKTHSFFFTFLRFESSSNTGEIEREPVQKFGESSWCKFEQYISVVDPKPSKYKDEGEEQEWAEYDEEEEDSEEEEDEEDYDNNNAHQEEVHAVDSKESQDVGDTDQALQNQSERKQMTRLCLNKFFHDMVCRDLHLGSICIQGIPMRDSDERMHYDVILMHTMTPEQFYRHPYKVHFTGSGRESKERNVSGSLGTGIELKSRQQLLQWKTAEHQYDTRLFGCTSMCRVTPLHLASMPSLVLMKHVSSGKSVFLCSPLEEEAKHENDAGNDEHSSRSSRNDGGSIPTHVLIQKGEKDIYLHSITPYESFELPTPTTAPSSSASSSVLSKTQSPTKVLNSSSLTSSAASALSTLASASMLSSAPSNVATAASFRTSSTKRVNQVVQKLKQSFMKDNKNQRQKQTVHSHLMQTAEMTYREQKMKRPASFMPHTHVNTHTPAHPLQSQSNITLQDSTDRTTMNQSNISNNNTPANTNTNTIIATASSGGGGGLSVSTALSKVKFALESQDPKSFSNVFTVMQLPLFK